MKKFALLLFFFVSSLCFSQKEKWDDNKDDWTPLMHAIYNGENKKVSNLIAQNVDVTYTKKNHLPLNALHIAILSKNIFAVKVLFATNKFESIDSYLDNACYVNNVEIAEFFIEKGANVNKESENGHTVLLSASISGTPEIMRCLLRNGAGINHQRKVDGITALMLATFNGDLNKVKILLQFGADKNIRDWNDKTALDYINEIYPRKNISDRIKIELRDLLTH